MVGTCSGAPWLPADRNAVEVQLVAIPVMRSFLVFYAFDQEYRTTCSVLYLDRPPTVPLELHRIASIPKGTSPRRPGSSSSSQLVSGSSIGLGSPYFSEQDAPAQENISHDVVNYMAIDDPLKLLETGDMTTEEEERKKECKSS